MSNYAEGREAFRAAVRVAEEAAAAAEQETPPLPELDGAEPIQASDQPLEPVVEPVERTEIPVPEAEQTPAEETPEQLRERLAVLTARLEEKDTFIGRQSSEVGELRQVVDELSARVTATATPASSPVAITQELIDTDPGHAVLIAYEQKNEHALAIAFEAWKMEDPFTAGSWLTTKQAEQREQSLRAEIEGIKSEVQTLAKPQKEAVERDAWRDAFAIVSEKHTDFLDNAARILEEVAPNYPAILASLATGDAKAKAEILTALYSIDRAGNPEAFTEQLKQEAEAAAAEAAANRTGAAVVTQTTAGQGSAAELTAEQEEIERQKARIGGGVSLQAGWTGRSGS